MRIAIGVDWSDQTFTAVTQAFHLYHPTDVTLVHGVNLGFFEQPIIAEATNLQGYNDFRNAMVDAGRQLLDRTAAMIPSDVQTVRKINEIGSPAQIILDSAETVSADLVVVGADRIAIGSNFTGAALSVTAVVERDAMTVPRAGGYDAVVSVRGPRGALSVWKKEHWGLLWLNRDQRKYIAVPAFISVLSNRPLEAIASESQRQRHRIGVAALVPEQSAARGGDSPEFRAALERLRRQEGLFQSNESAVRFITPNVLQGRIEIPGRAPLGQYDVDVALFADGVLLARAEQSFSVTKAGVEQLFTIVAHEMSLLYGLATSLIALFFGWLASAVFRRD